MEGPGVCYCGAYGGGVHTRSSLCPKPDPQPIPPLADGDATPLHGPILEESSENGSLER